jgi:hypothetical protein
MEFIYHVEQMIHVEISMEISGSPLITMYTFGFTQIFLDFIVEIGREKMYGHSRKNFDP